MDGFHLTLCPGTPNELRTVYHAHPDNPAFAQLHAYNGADELVGVVNIGGLDNGNASVDVRATAGHPVTASIGAADGSLPYRGTA